MGKQIEAAFAGKKSTRNWIASVSLIVVVSLFCWFGVRTQLGNMLAELTSPSRDDAGEVADVAISMVPNDPKPRWLSAMSLKRSFAAADVDMSVQRLEEAVRRNPNSYRSWTDLAGGYEQSERYQEAEAALKRSIELAPAYAWPHWQMANFLLRQERVDEAKVELRRVTQSNSPYRDQAYGLMWNYFGNDPAVVEEIASDDPQARLALANFYADRGSGRNAIRIWNTLAPEHRQLSSTFVRLMAYKLASTGFPRESMSVARDIGMLTIEKAETINNGGFEQPIGEPYEKIFWWKVFRNDNKFEALPDSRYKTEGSRSLKIVFRNYEKPQLYNVAQTVVVEPLQKYRLTFKVRTDNLRSAGLPYVDIAAFPSYQQFAHSEPFPIGSNDWQEIAVDFVTPLGVSGIEVRTMRIGCAEECAINGTIWYDDFKLSRL